MFKKIKRSIEEMPRPAYIFLKNSRMFSDILLFFSSLLYLSPPDFPHHYERIRMAKFMLETPAGILILTLIGFAIILDRC